MNRSLKTAWLVTSAALVLACRAQAQSPAGPPLLVLPEKPDFQGVDSVAVAPDGGVVVAWEDGPLLSEPGANKLLLSGFSVQDSPLGSPYLVARDPSGGCCFAASMAENSNGELVVAFPVARPQARRYGFTHGPQNLKLNSSRKAFPRDATNVAMDSLGDFVVVWVSQGQELPSPTDAGTGIFGRLVSPFGAPRGPEFHVNSVEQGRQVSPAVSMAAETGAFVVVWETNPTGNGAQVGAQLFSPAGARVGGEFRIGSVIDGAWQPHAAVAMAPNGSFVVVWQEPVEGNASTYIILGQRFSAEGAPAGSQLRISEGLPGRQEYPQIACDPYGNFVVTWNEDGTAGVTMSRLYRANGTPVTKSPIALTQGVGQEGAAVAFGSNGTFAIGWTEMFPPIGTIAHVRRFSASPGPEFCIFRSGVFSCDTGRTGGIAEVRHPFGGDPGDIGLLGDVDGDGRADPCVFRGGRFLCDTAHDYGAAEFKEKFGQSGDTPLLGDIDGDGRADPCVFRSGHFLCDSAHDGQVHQDLSLPFQPGDLPLLGDVDGDGRADPCLFRAGLFLCDVHHDGSVGLTIPFGRLGDTPLLADFDGDGIAKPCVYRGKELLCRSGQNGGSVQTILTFGDGSGTPLVGNLDGL
jgi:hypothetical protein